LVDEEVIIQERERDGSQGLRSLVKGKARGQMGLPPTSGSKENYEHLGNMVVVPQLMNGFHNLIRRKRLIIQCKEVVNSMLDHMPISSIPSSSLKIEVF